MRTLAIRDLFGKRFWQIERRDRTLTVRWTDAEGEVESISRNLPTEAAARAMYRRLSASKQADGYTRASARDMPSPKPSPRRIMENALVENPDDLGMHRAYADYLIEQDDPRGEFIQVQLLLEDYPQRFERPPALIRRAGELILEHGRTWLGELAPFLLDDAEVVTTPFQFGRGWLEKLTVSRLTEQCAVALARAPQLRLLHTLEIERIWGLLRRRDRNGWSTPLEPLLLSPYLGNVRSLEINQCEHLGSDLTGVLDPFALPRLTHLRLHGGSQGDAFCEALAASGRLGRLQTLEMKRLGVTERGVRALTARPELKQLELLALDYNPLTAAGLHLLHNAGVNFRADSHRAVYHEDDDLYDSDWE